MTLKAEDPSTKMLRSGFGKQPKSANETVPQWGFGTSHRDAFMKLYLSPEQSKAMNGNNSQGPVYKPYSAIGPQPESKYSSLPAPGFGTAGRSMKYKNNVPGPGAYTNDGGLGPQKVSQRATSPRAVFGSSTRDAQSKVWLDEELMKTYCGRESPGPNTYQTPGGIGKMPDGKYSSAPAWRQGTSERFKYKDNNKDFPGVGSYNNYQAIGKQTLSQKKTLPTPKIGTGERDAFKKIFISKEHEKGSFGLWSPGPTTGQFVSSIGAQKLSVKSSAPSWGFGTSKRGPGFGNDTPGPGTYYA